MSGGVVLFDYDNDGLIDVYLVNGSSLEILAGKAQPVRSRLFRNLGDGRFEDVTGRAGVGATGWGMGGCAADYDNDGWTDLYVTNLGRNVLYHNNGDGTFTDVTGKAGVGAGGWSTGAVWADYDNDGAPDLYVGNDAVPNYLYRNDGNGKFTEVGLAAGVAVDEDGREQASMGVDFGDYDGDGRLDLYVTNFSDEPNALYRNEGRDFFREVTRRAGHFEPTWNYLGWATAFFDFDNDGDRKSVV